MFNEDLYLPLYLPLWFQVLVVLRFRKAMTGAGFTISGEDHAISPVMLGDAKAFITFTTNHGLN
jgi:hypothetical protein